jgi:hypothetical protein
MTMTWPTLTDGRRYIVAALMPNEGGYGSQVLANGLGDTAADALRDVATRLSRTEGADRDDTP